MMPGSLRDWLVTFVIAVARDVDARTGSAYEMPIEAAVALHSPMIALDWSISELRAQVGEVLAGIGRTKSGVLRSRAPSSP